MPKEVAANKPAILALLNSETAPSFIRMSEPIFSQLESDEDRAVNQQGAVRNQTGFVFQTDAFKKKGSVIARRKFIVD